MDVETIVQMDRMNQGAAALWKGDSWMLPAPAPGGPYHFSREVLMRSVGGKHVPGVG